MNPNPLSKIFVAVAAVFALASCTQMEPYHSTASAAGSIDHKDGYNFAFIEFGEQGSYQDPRQLEQAIKLIKAAPRPLVVTYVHGWHNDAESHDVNKFRGLLAALGKSDIIRNNGFQVIGVYLGWRGEATRIPVLSELSFFNRKVAAERLASNFDCFDAIASVSEAARTKSEQYTILMGHSFGGLVVERSVAHGINQTIHGHANLQTGLPADLILLVNPASDSILTRQMIAALYSRHQESKRQFIVSLTSTTDEATGGWFPFATRLGAFSKGFNQVEVPAAEAVSESERTFFTSTPGHNQLLLNHYTVKRTSITNISGTTAFGVNLTRNLVGHGFVTDPTPPDSGKLDVWQFKKRGGVDVPYWDVAVDPAIIKDHGDIWNERAIAMMAAIFRMNFPRQLAASVKSASPIIQKAAAVTAPAASAASPADLQQKPDFNRLSRHQ